MGKRGPPPTPKAILAMRGSWRAKERADVPGSEKIPPCPRWLGREAKACWKRTIPLIAEMRVLRSADEAALVRYCQLWEQWVAAAKFVQKNGDTYQTVDANGNTIHRERPESKKCRELHAALLRVEGEFGLTASARSSLKPEAAPDKAGVAAFARKRG